MSLRLGLWLALGLLATVSLVGVTLLATVYSHSTDPRFASSSGSISAKPSLPNSEAETETDTEVYADAIAELDTAVVESPPEVESLPPAASIPRSIVSPDPPKQLDSSARDPIVIDVTNVPVIGGPLPADSAASSSPSSNSDETPLAGPETLDVGFTISGCAPSFDGRQLAVWGYDESAENSVLSVARIEGQRPVRSRLAVLDCETKEVLVDRELFAAITQVDFNATGIYVTATENGSSRLMSVLRLDPNDLQSLGRSSLPMGSITSIANRLLVCEPRSKSLACTYQLPTLQPIEPNTPRRNLSSPPNPACQLATGWLYDGVIWDPELREPQMLASLPHFQQGTLNTSHSSSFAAVPKFPAPVSYTVSGNPSTDGNQRVERPRYSPHVPAQMSLSAQRGGCVLQFLDFNKGKLLRSESLNVSMPRHCQIVTTPQWIFATLDSQTVVLPIQSEREPLPAAFHILPKQSTLILSHDSPTTVQYTAVDAVKFELELPGLVIDGESYVKRSANGEFTIDLASHVPQFIQELNRKADQQKGLQGNDIAVWADSYGERIRARFTQLTGRDPVGLPFKMDAYVRAYGPQFSVAVLHHIYLFEVPFSVIEDYRGTETSTTDEIAARRPVKNTARDQSQKFWTNFRVWTDSQERTLVARLIGREGKSVLLEDLQHHTLQTPLDRLSKRDRIWIDTQDLTNAADPGTPQ